MKKIQFLAAGLFLLIGISSCSHRLTDFTVISTKNVPLGNKAASLQKADERVKGVDKAHTVLFLPLGIPNMKEAIDKAIAQYPGAIGLADGVVKCNNWHILLYGQNSYIVEGTPIYESNENQDENETNTRTNDNQSQETMVFFHEVKERETLSSIAATYNVKIANIIKWNKLSSDSDITKGDKLKILIQ